MAYPKEQEHVDYMNYRIAYDEGDVPGPFMTKEEWRKKRDQDAQDAAQKQKQTKPVKKQPSDG